MGLKIAALAAIVIAHDLACVESLRSGEIRKRAVDLVTPRILPLIRAARGFLPLCFRGQAVFLAGLRA